MNFLFLWSPNFKFFDIKNLNPFNHIWYSLWCEVNYPLLELSLILTSNEVITDKINVSDIINQITNSDIYPKGKVSIKI